MAARPLLPVAVRASRQCPRLLVLSRIPSHSFGSTLCISKGFESLRIQKFRGSSLFTLAANQPRKRPGIPAWDRQKCVAQFGLQKRGSAKKPTDAPEAPESPESKKSPVLSRLPLRTHENIYTIPNILTFSRLVAAPLVGYFLVYDHHAAALALFAYAGVTDLADGYIARRFNLQTVVGTIIDPMADKLLMTISVACLAVNGSIPVWLAVIILGRDIGLALSAIYYRWISLPPPKTMARYWDFSLPSAEVKPTNISKANTALQLLLVGSAIALPVVPETLLEAWHLKEAMIGFQ
ncbi:hypothetical protein AOCH_007378 [Aspergillus ochraceoroseus]|nr:hypothetical protein AOCH_007378 [Aspergillus ochraceoroseus]